MTILRENVYKRLLKELTEKGWSPVSDEQKLLRHHKHGCHNIFKAAYVQRDCDLARSRKIMWQVFVILLALLVAGNSIGYILTLLGVH